jgi:hypothetical protein
MRDESIIAKGLRTGLALSVPAESPKMLIQIQLLHLRR